jgi:hypothetical protein
MSHTSHCVEEPSDDESSFSSSASDIVEETNDDELKSSSSASDIVEDSDIVEETNDDESKSSSSDSDIVEDSDDSTFSPETVDKFGKKGTQLSRMVTNGFGFNQKTSKCVFLVKQVTPENESALARHQFSPPFILLCAAWSQRRKAHFFHESAHVVQSTADEVGMSLSDYLFVHGWTVSRKSNKPSRPFGICYSAFQSGLDLFQEKGIIQDFRHKKMLIFRFTNLICKLDSFLRTKKAPIETVPDSPSRIENDAPSNRDKSPSKEEWMQHSSSQATPHLRPPETLIRKINNFTQHYHLCVSITHIIYGEAIGNNANKNVFHWMHLIFEECSSHRKVLQGLINLCLLYPTREVIAVSGPEFIESLRRPQLILVNAERRVKGKSLDDYHALLLGCMKQLFPKSSPNYIGRSSDKNHAIIRMRIIEMMENLNGGCGKRKRGDPPCRPVPCSLIPPTDSVPVITTGNECDGLQGEQAQPDCCETTCLPMSEFFNGMSPNFETTALNIADTGANAYNHPSNSTDNSTDLVSPDSYESNLDQRFLLESVRPPSYSDILAIRPQLVVEDHEGGIRYVMDCTGFEFYVNASLRSRRHRFTYKDEEPSLDSASSELVLLTVSPRRNFLKDPNFIVLRHDHAIVTECFGNLRIPFGEFAYLICKSNNTCTSRDGGNFNGYRIDWGTPDHSYDTSTDREPGVPCPPVAFSGRAPFESSIGTRLIKITGILFDRIQVALDRAYEQLKVQRVYDDPVRELLFADKIRRWFGGTKCRGEWMTLQLKCISRRDKTLEHVDGKNCGTPNYDVTAAFCVMFYDNYDQLWSLKFILNSRAAPGNYLSKEITYSRLTAVIKSHTDSLDSYYDSYLRSCKQRPLVDSLTWKNYLSFFLYDHSPWQPMALFPQSTITVRILALRAAPSRNYWESAPVHRICQARSLANRTQVISLILPGLFQHDWTYFWIITGIMFQEKDAPIDWREDPCAAYFELSKKTFGKFVGGPFGRFSPSGINFMDTYLGLENKRRKDNVIQILECLIDDLSTIPVHSCLSLQEKVVQTLNKLSPLQSQIGEFTLVLFIKLVGLAGYLCEGVSALAYIYPVPDMGSYKALTKAHVLPKNHLFAMDVLVASLGFESATSEMIESLLCESHKARSALDVFYYGQNLYTILKFDGIYRVVRKEFGTTNWVIQV